MAYETHCARLRIAAACIAVSAGCVRSVGPAEPHVRDDPFIRARDGRLVLGGQRFRFIGVNVYSLLSAPAEGEGYGCGRRHSDQSLEEIFREVRQFGGRVVRAPVFQSFTEGGANFDRLDLVIAKANRHGVKLLLTFENQWADCTEGAYKYAEWYREGYRRPYGRYPLSYRDYVRLVVERYQDEPAILMWQLMNEAEAKTRGGRPDPEALLLFAADMGAVVKARDRNHLVSLGLLGGDQPGIEGDAFARLAALPWLDVIEVHDYGAESEPLPMVMRRCLDAARRAGKPCIVDEIGMSAGGKSGKAKRADLIIRKLDAAYAAGIDGMLIWSYRAGDGVHMDFDRRDPLYDALRERAPFWNLE